VWLNEDVYGEQKPGNTMLHKLKMAKSHNLFAIVKREFKFLRLVICSTVVSASLCLEWRSLVTIGGLTNRDNVEDLLWKRD